MWKGHRQPQVKGVLSPAKLHGLKTGELAALIKAGYFNIKAKRLKNFTDYLLRSITAASTGF